MSELPKGVTEGQVQEWKDKHGKVKQITFTRDNKETADFIIGRPTRSIMDAWAHHFNKEDLAKARGVLQNSCILNGDTSLFEKDINLQTSVLKKIQEMLEEVQAEEKEL